MSSVPRDIGRLLTCLTYHHQFTGACVVSPKKQSTTQLTGISHCKDRKPNSGFSFKSIWFLMKEFIFVAKHNSSFLFCFDFLWSICQSTTQNAPPTLQKLALPLPCSFHFNEKAKRSEWIECKSKSTKEGKKQHTSSNYLSHCEAKHASDFEFHLVWLGWLSNHLLLTNKQHCSRHNHWNFHIGTAANYQLQPGESNALL